MIHFTCTNCTADLSAEDSQRFIKCGWCRNQVTVPRLTKIELDSFTRANRQRQNKQFAEAEKNYQLVLNAHPQDHEALWGLVLCHYGIVYVEDKGDVLPTCWICRPQPILEHPDFKDACELAPAEIRAQRKRDGQYICKAQQDIRHLSETMQPYDIFLCYKHSVIGNPDALTEDSQLANDLCLMLSKEGYRVFYAPVDTKGRAGENYESLIYHALKTAKVMLTISTRPDHLLCSWPKSEWSRFIYMMNQGEDKHLIPLYKHMRVSALPDAFLNRGWQALNMNEPLYGKYLLDNLERFIHKRHEKAAPPVSEPVAEPQAAYLCAAATLFAKPDAASKSLNRMPQKSSVLVLNRVRAANGAFWYMVQVGVSVGYVAYDAVKLGEAPLSFEDQPVANIAPSSVQQRGAEGTNIKPPMQETPINHFTHTVSEDGTVTILRHKHFLHPDKKIVIPQQVYGKAVTAIGDDVFNGYARLTSIVIPDGITSIGSLAFAGCTGLTSLHLPDSVTLIGDHAFYGCYNLTDFSIPNSVTSIGRCAFYNCTGLTSLTIPNSVTSIEYGAFWKCRNLTSIYISHKTTSIWKYAFKDCPNLTIHAPRNSTAIDYARANNIPYVITD